MHANIATKSTLLLVLVIAIQFAASIPVLGRPFKDSHAGHNLHLGSRQEGDSLLHNYVINDKPVSNFYATEWFKFPGVNETVQNITYLEVVNLQPKGQDGIAILTDGGPGANNASLFLLSRLNEGINFNISIYGN